MLSQETVVTNSSVVMTDTTPWGIFRGFTGDCRCRHVERSRPFLVGCRWDIGIDWVLDRWGNLGANGGDFAPDSVFTSWQGYLLRQALMRFMTQRLLQIALQTGFLWELGVRRRLVSVGRTRDLQGARWNTQCLLTQRCTYLTTY